MCTEHGVRGGCREEYETKRHHQRDLSYVRKPHFDPPLISLVVQ